MPASPLVEDRFDEMNRKDAGHQPCRQNQRDEGESIFHGRQKTL
jgi:hypothetical protein